MLGNFDFLRLSLTEHVVENVVEEGEGLSALTVTNMSRGGGSLRPIHTFRIHMSAGVCSGTSDVKIVIHPCPHGDFSSSLMSLSIISASFLCLFFFDPVR